MFTFKKPEKVTKKPEKATWKLCSEDRPPWDVAVLFNVFGANEDFDELPTEMFTGVLSMVIATKDGTTLKVRTIAGEITLPAEITEWMENPKPSRKVGTAL